MPRHRTLPPRPEQIVTRSAAWETLRWYFGEDLRALLVLAGTFAAGWLAGEVHLFGWLWWVLFGR